MLRIACFSDTHTQHEKYQNFDNLDVLIHSGDCSNDGSECEIRTFLEWFALVPVKHKIFVPGNHDKALETNRTFKEEMLELAKKHKFHILLNESTLIEGIEFYGSPDIFYAGYRWFAFGKVRSKIEESWNKIPATTQVLITHTPPFGILDESWGEHQGDEILMEKLLYFPRLKAHVFGHIHHSSGHLVRNGINFVNGCAYSEGKLNPLRKFNL